MRFFRTGILVLAVLLIGAVVGFAQQDSHTVTVDIGNVQVLEISNAGITLNSGNPSAPGLSDFTGDTDSTTELYYTLLSSSTGTITAQVDVLPPANTSLTIEAINVAGYGSSAGVVTPVATATDYAIINTVPASIATGRAGAGPNLEYVLSFTGVPAAGSTVITVLVTLSSP